MNMETTRYESKDLSLAAALYALGAPLQDTRHDRGVCFFIFDDAERCEQFVRAYYNGSAMVSAKAYADAMRTLKDLIFGGKYGGTR